VHKNYVTFRCTR